MKPTEKIDQFIQISGTLFEAVQMSGIFPDSKTFVDSVPKTDPDDILKAYEKGKESGSFDLESFVREHFRIPDGEAGEYHSSGSMEEHIEQLWTYLSREPDEEISKYSTLIPLPHPYIVPGGRFREIYYWDTYFTAEGLAASGHVDIVENLVLNFNHLVRKIGHVPNGNRYYYQGRSQPPFLVMLVDLLRRYRGEYIVKDFLPALKQEHAFWMDGSDRSGPDKDYRRVVQLKDGVVLNRYWDDRPLPREESWREDVELAESMDTENTREVYLHIRAAAESGWDFTSRWLQDQRSMGTIHTTEIIPADLNALLYALEKKLGEWSSGSEGKAFTRAAETRKSIYDRYFWNGREGFYFDYDWKQEEQTPVWSLAAVYPLFVGLASEEQAKSVADHLENKFLEEGGLVSSLHETGQQWDHPNGWAPLQWMAVSGLRDYGHDSLAEEIARRWLKLNRAVYDRTGKMMEKYNVTDLSLEGGGGEYPLQDGFGWTNGVAVALQDLYG